MNPLKFNVSILNIHQPRVYTYKINSDFFSLFEYSPVKNGDIDVILTVSENSNNFINFSFSLLGHIELACDSTLEMFSYPLNVKEEVLFSFGDKFEEFELNHYGIKVGTSYVDISTHLYDFIILEIPIKKIAPN